MKYEATIEKCWLIADLEGWFDRCFIPYLLIQEAQGSRIQGLTVV